MEELNQIISEALKTGELIEFKNLTVETNGKIVFYFINDTECTGSQALEYIESL